MDVVAFNRLMDIYESSIVVERSHHGEDVRSKRVVENASQLSHVLTMIPKMRDMLKTNEFGKFFRWLGFVQGVLWSNHIFTIDDMRGHNRDICSLGLNDGEDK